MSKSVYTGIGGIAKNTKSIYVGVNGIARKVVKGYIGVGGVARQFYPGIVYTWKKYSSTKWNYVSNDERADTEFHSYLITCYKNIALNYYRRNYETIITFDSSTGTWNPGGTTLAKTYNLTAGVEMSCNAYWGSILGLNGVDLTIVGNVPYYDNNSGTFKHDIRINVTGPNPNKNWALSMNNTMKNRYVEEATLVADTSSYVGDVISSNPNAYPDNGKHTDGYWYIKQ